MSVIGRRSLPWVLAAAGVLLAGCTAAPPAPPTPSRTAATGGTGPAPGGAGPAYQLRCVFPDGSPAGTYSSLDAVWASVPFVKMDHCVASFASGTPTAPTAAEIGTDASAALHTAAAQLPGQDVAAVYLDVLAACARIPPGGGAHGVASHPVPVLRATQQVCPHAPGAAIVDNYLESVG